MSAQKVRPTPGGPSTPQRLRSLDDGFTGLSSATNANDALQDDLFIGDEVHIGDPQARNASMVSPTAASFAPSHEEHLGEPWSDALGADVMLEPVISSLRGPSSALDATDLAAYGLLQDHEQCDPDATLVDLDLESKDPTSLAPPAKRRWLDGLNPDPCLDIEPPMLPRWFEDLLPMRTCRLSDICPEQLPRSNAQAAARNHR